MPIYVDRQLDPDKHMRMINSRHCEKAHFSTRKTGDCGEPLSLNSRKNKEMYSLIGFESFN